MAGILLNRSRQVPAEETPAFGGIAERFRRAGDLDRAIALCRDGLKRFPEQLSARVTLGWALLDKGQYDAARVELEYVLRKAPDNLAAIRGLAELHDRTEGALPADDSSWKSDDAATVETTTTAAAEAPVEVFPPPQPAAVVPPPIPVSFQSTGAEVLHTAAQAELDAAASLSSPIDAHEVAATPVELEDAASASLNGADPAPFFVEAAETVAFDVVSAADVVPVPFEVPTVDEVKVELETPGAAALAAVDESSSNELDALTLKFGAFTDAPATAVELSTPADEAISHVAEQAPADWAGLTALSTDIDTPHAASWDDEPSVAAFDAGIVSEEATDIAATGFDPSFADLDTTLELEALQASALDGNGDDVTAVFEAAEGLEDIDEAAGQELADAIRALEEAAKRVEARLAPPSVRNEPGASPEEIAAFDFASIVADTAAGDEPAQVDPAFAGAFELASPNLADLTFSTPDVVGDDHVESQGEVDALENDGPSFDFESVGETESSVTPGDAAADWSTLIAGVVADATTPAVDEIVPAEAVDTAVQDAAPAVDVPVFGEWSPAIDEAAPAGAPAIDDEQTLEAVEASFETVAFDAATDDSAESAVEGWPDGADVSAVDGTGGGVDVAALFPVADTSERLTADALAPAEVVAEPGACASADDAHDFDLQSSVSDVAAVDLSSWLTTSDEPAGETDVHVEVELDAAAEVADENRDGAAGEPAEEPGLVDITSDLVAAQGQVADVDVEVELPHAALERADVSEAPVMHVYDVPVFGAVKGATTAALNLVSSSPAPAVGVTTSTTRARQLAGLERFLRQVQARQLELRGETVA